MNRIVIALLPLLFGACALTSTDAEGRTNGGPVDSEATAETKALFRNLRANMGKGVMFGHQDDLAYGVKWWAEQGRSDVREVAGAYPAVYGWELANLEYGRDRNIDSVSFAEMNRWVREGFERGGVVTMSWHMDNPVTAEGPFPAGSSWDTTRSMHTIAPGGIHHTKYRAWLDRFAIFAHNLKDSRGRLIPIIFRPFHENTGSWFWWGGDNTTPETYVAVWRFTVDYLRDTKQVHNLLYAYSTDVFQDEAQFMRLYPGDAYVDVLGFDDYQGLRTDETVPQMARRMEMIVRMADARGKIGAMTEGGLGGCSDPDMWTSRLLRAVETNDVSRRLSFMVMWRNAPEWMQRNHFYVPYPGQASAEDFVSFTRHPMILLENELPPMYR